MTEPNTEYDLLIKARWIIPIVPAQAVLEHAAIAIRNGKISAILTDTEAAQAHAREVITLPQHAIMPGLINAHTHAAMTLLRGYADDLALMKWLQEHIWPTEERWVSEEFVHDGTQLAIAEMLRSGTTCFSDMYFFPEVASQVAHHAGIRAQICFPVFDFPSAWGQGPDDYIHKGLQLHDHYRNSQLIDIAFGPHAPYTVSNAPLERIAMLAAELDSNIQIHVHETGQEIINSLKEHGVRPLQRLDELGLLTPRTQCVHATQLDDDDLARLSNNRSHVIHCPQSNLKLASGFCPTHKLQQHQINTALGTDGAASNNGLNLFSELQAAALLAKGVSGDPAMIPAHRALQMATLDGAKALGIDHLVGSLEIGKQADIIAINLGEIEQQPIYSPISQLAYTDVGHCVEHLWVNGRQLLKDRHPTTLNLLELTERAARWHEQIGQ